MSELQTANIDALKSLKEQAEQQGEAILIDSIEHIVSKTEYRLFYDPLTLSFILGPNATIEGFVMEDGTVLEEEEYQMKPCFLDNVLSLGPHMFEDEESMIGYIHNLWLSMKLFVYHSNELDPSFITTTMFHRVIFGETDGERVLIDYSNYTEDGALDGHKVIYSEEEHSVIYLIDGETKAVHSAPTLDDVGYDEYAITSTVINITNQITNDFVYPLMAKSSSEEEVETEEVK